MEAFEFEQLLKSRFQNIRCELTKGGDAASWVNLACRGCGWTMLFQAQCLRGWDMSKKDGIVDWLLRHCVCKKTFGT